MGDFDYSRDIAPLRGNFFSNPRLTDRERTELRSQFSNEIAPLMEVNDRIAEAAREKRRDELAYQKGLFDLRNARASKREERIALEKNPEVVAFLSAAFDAPGSNTVTRARAVAEASSKYAQHIAKNPALGVTIDAYSKRLTIESGVEKERMEEEKVAREKETAKKFARADNLRDNGVPLEIIKSRVFEADDGVIDADEEAYSGDVGEMTKSTLARSKAEREYTVAAGTQEAALRARDKNIEGFHGVLDRLEAANADILGDDGISYDQKGGADKPPAFSLSELDTVRIKTALNKLHGVPYEEMPKDPLALFAFALEKKYDLLDSALPKADPTGSFWDE
jgi:hypothetical protein